MTFPRPGRAAALALVLAVGLTPLAQASGFGRRCHNNCADSTVQLPAQRVVVDTAPTRVITDTYQPTRGLAMPVVGTAFAPLALPVATFGIAASSSRDVDPLQDDNPLRSVHAAEVHKVRHARALAAARAEVEAAKNVLDRSATPTDSRQVTTPRDTTDLEKSLQDLSDKVKKLEDRVNAVEKLILIHDNYLQDKIKKGNTTP
jgi:hypothetical protein